MTTRCQICGKQHSNWRVTRATFDVGTLRNYAVQACEVCAERIEVALVGALAIRKHTEPKEHVLSGVECWCNPRIDRRPGYDTVVVHNSEGGRELVEGGTVMTRSSGARAKCDCGLRALLTQEPTP